MEIVYCVCSWCFVFLFQTSAVLGETWASVRFKQITLEINSTYELGAMSKPQPFPHLNTVTNNVFKWNNNWCGDRMHEFGLTAVAHRQGDLSLNPGKKVMKSKLSAKHHITNITLHSQQSRPTILCYSKL